MKNIDIDTWVNGCKVRAFSWVDGENYYVSVQGFAPGGVVSRPAWEKTVYVAGNDDGYIMLKAYLHTFVEQVRRMEVAEGNKCVLTVELSDLQRKMSGVVPLRDRLADANARAASHAMDGSEVGCKAQEDVGLGG